jgi:tetratricopeptide (TPR) repeat protein/serine/threonine protein kinase
MSASRSGQVESVGGEASLALLVERITARLQAGEALALAGLKQEHPEHAAQLDEVWPALQALAGLDRSPGAGSPADDTGAPGELGDFRIVREIGRGGMGVVYEAEQLSLGRRVALKVLPFAATMDARQLQRFHNEARAAACLHHTHIVPVYSVGCERGTHFYAMQLIEGRSLADLIGDLRRAQGPRKGEKPDEAPTTPYLAGPAKPTTTPVAALSTKEGALGREYFRRVAELGARAAEALDHAHQRGVVHRDVKPANLLLDDRGQVWVADFGLASFRQGEAGLTLTGDLVGTLRYMSPEQALAQRVVVDHRTDVYSLGVTLYELLTLQPAFPGQDRQELLRQVAFEEPRPPRRLNRSIPAELETIVLKAMEKNPAERYGTARELADDLGRFLRDEPIRARPPSLLGRARKWGRRHPSVVWSTAVGVLVALVVGAAGIGWALGDRSARRATVAIQVRDSLNAARALVAENRLAAARQKLAEARAQLGNDRAALGDLAAEVEAAAAALDLFAVFRERLDRAQEVATARRNDLDPARTRDQQRDAAVSFVLEALACYEVLERDDWSTRLEGGLLSRDQVEEVRRTVYEELLWLADDVFFRQQEPDSGQKLSPRAAAEAALVYLGKAGSAHRPTHALYVLRANCCKALGEEAAAEADKQLADKTPPTMAVDHDLRGREARRARKYAEAVQHFEAALRVEPTHYWSLIRLGSCLYDLEDFASAARVFTGCIMKRPDHCYAYHRRAFAYDKLRRYEEAVADWSRAIELDSSDVIALTARGCAYRDHLGQPARAVADFSRAIELDPTYTLAWKNRSVAYSNLGQWDKAAADYSRAAELDPKGALALGNACLNLGQYDKAVAHFSRAIELDRKNANAWYNRGFAYSNLAQWDKAVADYSRAIEFDPKLALAWGNRGVAYGSLGQYDKAVADFSQVIELSPKDAKTWCNRGNAYFNLGQLDKAVADYSRAIELGLKDAKTWCSRGNAYLKLGQDDKAVADFSRAIELDPKLAPAWTGRGAAYSNLGQWDKAAADHSKAIELDPKLALAWGDANLNLGQYDKAVADYSRAIELDPTFAPAWGGRGSAYSNLGQWDKAVADFSKAIELDPKYTLAWHGRGVAYFNLGQYDKAVADFSRAIELDPKLAPAWTNRGKAYGHLGQWDKAVADCSRAVELSPKDASVHNDLAWLRATCPDVKLRDSEQAVQLARRAVELAPEVGASWNTLGVAQYRAGDWKAAVVALEKSMALRQGGDAFDWLFLAMAQHKLGKPDEARKWYGQAVQWLEKNAPALAKSPSQADELRRFQAEAEEVLGLKKK